MTPNEKADFIVSLCDSCRNAILQKIQHMPDEWDGLELRQYIAREFAAQTHLDSHPHHKKRLREFTNTVATIGGL